MDAITLRNFKWWGIRKKWKQAANTSLGFLLTFGFSTFVHGMVINGIMNVNISTIERRYHLKSYESGLISSSYDMAFCVLCPLMTYYGNRHHRPRIMGAGMIMFALGCVVYTLPHFTHKKYDPKTYSDLCINRSLLETEENQPQSETADYLLVFVFGNILLGVGSIPIITLGVTYLEDSTTKEKAASYIGLTGGISAFGSVIGYLLGGYMLSHHVDITRSGKQRLEIEPDNPMWIGAWWVSLLLASGLAFLAMLLLIRFPKNLRGSILQRASRDSEVHAKSGSRITEQLSFGKSFKDFPTAFVLLLKNPTFLFTTMAASFETFLLNGFALFLPKLLQNQFHITPTEAGLMAGSVSVPGAIIGHSVSGYLVRKMGLKSPAILRASVIATIVSGFLAPCLILHCSRNTIINQVAETSRKPVCNDHCACNENFFLPVCGEDNVEYFSACHAGCHSQLPNETIYYNCSCVSTNANRTMAAKRGSCSTRCGLLIPFLVLLFILISFSFAVLTPSVVVVLRCVPYSQKSFALGVQWFFLRVIGSIPSPLVIGAVFDASCTVWRMQDGKEGSCWFYDSKSFAKSAIFIGVSCKVLTAICYSLAYKCYVPETQQTTGNDDRVKVGEDKEHMLPSSDKLETSLTSL
ncbi:solute carrier organic anion transporter family member 4C1-like isoform X1 [Styela clava]